MSPASRGKSGAKGAGKGGAKSVGKSGAPARRAATGGPSGRGGAAGRTGGGSASSRAAGAGGAVGAGGRGKSRSPAAEKALAARTERQRARSDAGRRAAEAKREARVAQRAAAPTRPTGRERTLGGEQVEGRHAVRELLVAGRRRVKEVWVAAREADDPRHEEHVDDLAELAQSMNVPVREVARRKLLGEARTEAPQGVLAKAAPLDEADLDTLATAPDPWGRPPFLVAVDGVTDPGNLGALLRSAECAGVTGVVLPRHRAVHITPTVTKAAAGAVEYLPMAIVGGLPSAIRDLQKQGIWVIGLDMDGEPMQQAALPADAGVCLVLGAEGKGLSRLVRQRCDAVVSLPLRGTLSSLNVAAAAAVACYEVARRRP